MSETNHRPLFNTLTPTPVERELQQAVLDADESSERFRRQYTEIASLAGGLAHELRNPLSTIRMNLQLLGEDLELGDDPRHQRVARKLDTIRRVITPAPTYSDAEREAVYRSLVYIGACLVDAGLPVIFDATAHRRAWRDLARAILPRFAEIQLVCPLEVCRWREAARPRGAAPAVPARPGKLRPCRLRRFVAIVCTAR